MGSAPLYCSHVLPWNPGERPPVALPLLGPSSSWPYPFLAREFFGTSRPWDPEKRLGWGSGDSRPWTRFCSPCYGIVSRWS